MSGTVRFVQGGRVVEVRGVDPTTTVLQWLRSQGRTGTKEGCAEGDCGACTVVVGELISAADGTEWRVRYRALNACILFLPMIDGKLLLTVEDLAAGDGALHPVQAALVDEHASQCGFCTPGFAMSLFALTHQETAAGTDDGTLHDALAGNLCRCTGYRPIIDAARRLLAARPAEDRFDRAEAGIVALLQAVAPVGSLALATGEGVFLAPETLADLHTAVGHHSDAVFVAGATDVGLWVTKQGKTLPVLISLARVAELRTVAVFPDRLEVGAAVVYADLLPVLDRRLPPLAALVRRIGAAQVRNAGTLGGNIANGSPIGDTMPALLALGASLVLDLRGERRTVALAAFYHGYRSSDLKPGEIIERVVIPLPDPAARFAVWKVCKRRDQDISAVCAGFFLRLDADGRVAEFRAGYGGMAAVPARARCLEAAVLGQPWTAATVAAALPALDRDFTPMDDARASSGYRRLVAGNLLRRFFLETTGAPVSLEAAHG